MIVPFVTTVDSILKSFQTQVNDLKKLSEKHTQDAFDKEEQANSLKADAEELRVEAKRAASVANKIANLIS